jgi:hypothetical protein
MLARMWGKMNIYRCWWKCKLVKHKAIWRYFKKLKLELPYNLGITLLGIYSKECKPGYNKDICTSMFIAAIFVIAKLCTYLIFPTHN